MQLDHDLAGLFGVTLAIVSILARMPRVRGLPLLKKAAVSAAVVVVLSLPVWGLSVAGLVRGITGDLSITALLLLVLALTRSLSGRALVEDANRRRTLQAITVGALVFYPLALGLGMFDPYRLGYGDLWFVLALLGLSVWAAWRYSPLLALCIALAVAAWSGGWYESPNLWDYLLDPWLAIYALVAQVKYWLTYRRGESHA